MAARNILVINCGSSSIKFALVNEAHSHFTLSGLAERLGSPEAVLHWQRGSGEKDSLMLPGGDHRAALHQLLPLVQGAAGGQLHGIGHRVVHGGEQFTSACRIDVHSLQAIRATAPLAPLHNPANLLGIEAALKLFPNLTQVAVFDTAFHQSLPEHAYRYAVPETLYREHGVRRYGFHGTSHRFVSHRAAEMAGLAYGDSSWLSAHLGNGCSTCAVVDGQSLDTSMGLTPLEGLVMGTRSGDVDPNLHGHLARTLGWSLEKIDAMLNKDSGLLGLSGLSNDMRSLEQAREQGHPGATLAIEVFCYRLAKSLAAMGCALAQLDGLIFTGGIGENSPLIRSKTVAHLRLLGLALDKEANARCIRGVAGAIHAQGHPRVLVVPTNEERQIALDTLALLDT
ncbi:MULTISPECIES: acetate kinase [unclassified Pseudomonas]|uniref:acetate kinase n=1 Tax=unclassified Pseudomonas TaxID=196821 RepID=UPI002446C97C|nr:MULTISPECIES: acetate kinase [unclassified Pseudomonas]MDH0893833.1 acetate kinase [Pseudomonas sp. GD03875]MDH1064352.1 acetate kinase [Pseudomonas sp. GD03985]